MTTCAPCLGVSEKKQYSEKDRPIEANRNGRYQCSHLPFSAPIPHTKRALHVVPQRFQANAQGRPPSVASTALDVCGQGQGYAVDVSH